MHKNGVYFKRKNEKLVKLRTVFGVAALLLGHSQVSAMSLYTLDIYRSDMLVACNGLVSKTGRQKKHS